MNILVTGGTGFVGSHMIDYILWNELDCKIYSTKRWMEDTKNIDHIDDGRFEFINYAWKKLNEFYSIDLVKNQLLQMLEN